MGAYIFLFTVFPNNDIIFKFIHTITVVPGVKERPQHKGFNEFFIVRLLEDSLVKIL